MLEYWTSRVTSCEIWTPVFIHTLHRSKSTSTRAMTIFRCYKTRLMQAQFIIICSLATIFDVEALQELVYDPIKYPDYTTVEPFESGTVVKIPGLITAITAYSWKDNEFGLGFAYSFAVSDTNFTSAQIQLFTHKGKHDAFFCSFGIDSGGSSDMGTIIFQHGVPRYFWRAPCTPAEIRLKGNNASCALVLTPQGDLQLLDVVANKIIWRSDTNGVGQTNVTVDDTGNLSLVRTADNRTVWKSRDNYTSGYDPKCSTFSSNAGILSGEFKVLEIPGGVRCFLLTFLTSAMALLLPSL